MACASCRFFTKRHICSNPAAPTFMSRLLPMDRCDWGELVAPLTHLLDGRPIKKNSIFVFGSNLSGIHGAGAAATALRYFGARWGQGEGMQGMSYALPTKDRKIQTLPLTEIRKHVEEFLRVVSAYPHLEFLLTKVGCGLAGYKDHEIRPLFAGRCPANVVPPPEWSPL